MPTPAASVGVPSDSLYEGTSQTLTCSVTLPDTVDTDVNVTVDWTLDSTPITSSDRVVVSPVSSVRPPFNSTLRLSPLILTDAGQYSCQATATSSSPYITDSDQGNNTDETLTVTGMSATSQYSVMTDCVSSRPSSSCCQYRILWKLYCWSGVFSELFSYCGGASGGTA